jgi:MIP family channel proteins
MANDSFSFDLSDPKALAAEFMGTLFLTLAAAGAGAAAGSIPGSGGGGATAAGLTLMAGVFMFGPISGAHFNPAISIGMTLAGRLPKSRTLPYLVAQVCGALVAGLLLRLALQSTIIGTTGTQMPPLNAVLIEAFLTFWLQWVILAVTEKDTPLVITGLSIGFALMAAGTWGGHLSGASLNPARTLGPAIAAWEFGQVWIYLLGPIAGASAAAGVYSWYKGLR